MSNEPVRPSKRRDFFRLPGYDYTEPGAYFVTLCTERRRHLFGPVVDGDMQLNEAGDMVHDVWRRLPERFPRITTDDLVVMPDHLHGIITLGTDPGIPATHRLGEIIRLFKSRTTNAYIARVKVGEWPPFDRRIWQPQFVDRIVRNDRELVDIESYIAANPALWQERNDARKI